MVGIVKLSQKVLRQDMQAVRDLHQDQTTDCIQRIFETCAGPSKANFADAIRFQVQHVPCSDKKEGSPWILKFNVRVGVALWSSP